jgi:quercetin dioxygenase-like cupin family protein
VTNDRRTFVFAGLAAFATSIMAARDAGGGQPKPGTPAKPLAQRDAPAVNLDGWQMTASEVSYAPGQVSGRHRHPGFVVGYVLEGQYQFAVNDNPAATLAAGQMFFESFDKPNEVHAISGNASKTQPCKILAIVFTKKGDPITIPG